LRAKKVRFGSGLDGIKKSTFGWKEALNQAKGSKRRKKERKKVKKRKKRKERKKKI